MVTKPWYVKKPTIAFVSQKDRYVWSYVLASARKKQHRLVQPGDGKNKPFRPYKKPVEVELENRGILFFAPVYSGLL
jgi:hypothetical protein